MNSPPHHEACFAALWGRRAVAVAAALVSTIILASCYVPNHFVSEIRLGRTGDFAMYYKGNLTWAPLFRDIKMGTVKPEEIPGKIQRIEDDIKRDVYFKSHTSLGDGVFDVVYEREGHLGDSEQATFIRRNAVIIMIKSYPDGRISVIGNGVKPAYAQMATDLGLGMKGEFRITTDAPVLEHNANAVETVNGYPVYIWKLDSVYAPSPKFVMRRDGVYPQPR
ncbi:hypothetical protein FACS1894205_1430 [Alphaproteobacteria bacterium]|nr:hypothetical protein FACS1894205_1430 [Alphaproteobacteria bacterium]